jgi:hypothetical protein
MEGNKDEALRALAIAQRHRDSGNFASARRFAEKSLKLSDTPEARKLLSAINREEALSTAGSAAGSSTAASGAEAHASTSSTRQRHAPSKSNGSATPDEKPREYTADNAKVVKRVRSCKHTDYYGILGLQRECEENDVKKAYRKVCIALYMISQFEIGCLTRPLVGLAVASRQERCPRRRRGLQMCAAYHTLARRPLDILTQFSQWCQKHSKFSQILQNGLRTTDTETTLIPDTVACRPPPQGAQVAAWRSRVRSAQKTYSTCSSAAAGWAGTVPSVLVSVVAGLVCVRLSLIADRRLLKQIPQVSSRLRLVREGSGLHAWAVEAAVAEAVGLSGKKTHRPCWSSCSLSSFSSSSPSSMLSLLFCQGRHTLILPTPSLLRRRTTWSDRRETWASSTTLTRHSSTRIRSLVSSLHRRPLTRVHERARAYANSSRRWSRNTHNRSGACCSSGPRIVMPMRFTALQCMSAGYRTQGAQERTRDRVHGHW